MGNKFIPLIVFLLITFNFLALAAQPPSALDLPPAVKGPGAPSRLDDTLRRISQEGRGALSQRPLSFSTRQFQGTSVETVRVLLQATAAEQVAPLASWVEKFGGRVWGTYQNYLDAEVPVGLLKDLEGMDLLKVAQVHHEPKALAVSGEQTGLMGSALGNTNGALGDQVKVAVIDLGFIGLSADKASGELPSGAVAVDYTGQGLEAGTSHGTAVAEIIYEMAPGATLYLLKVANSVQLGQAVNYCKAQGIKIINHSVGWFNTSFGDGTGIICDITADAKQSGILWFNSAGNEAQSHYGATFNGGNGGWMSFATSNYLNQMGWYNTGENLYVYLNWNDSWSGSANDYDLYIFRYTGSTWTNVTGSYNFQTGSQPPTEAVSIAVPTNGNYAFAIRHYSGSTGRKMNVFCSSSLQFSTPASSMPEPANASTVFTVGALAVSNWAGGAVENFSSLGPTADGRSKPDAVAADGMTNQVYGRFYGTSAASPAAAAVAAQIWGEYTNATAADVVGRLTNGADATGLTGGANSIGAGRIKASFPPSATGSVAATGLSFVTNPVAFQYSFSNAQRTSPGLYLLISTNGGSQFTTNHLVSANGTWVVSAPHQSVVLARFWASNAYGYTLSGPSSATVDDTAPSAPIWGSLPLLSGSRIPWVWSNGGDGESSVSGHTLEISRNGAFTQIEVVYSNLTSNQITSGPYADGSVRFARVTAANGAGVRTPSASSPAVTVDALPPTTHRVGEIPRLPVKPVTLRLESDDPTAVIYYTTNGGQVDISLSSRYTDPITLDKTTVLRYLALDPQGNREIEQTETIQFLVEPRGAMGVYGNWFLRGAGALRVVAKVAGKYRVVLKDPFHRVVKTWDTVQIEAGGVWEWDGKLGGRPLSPGNYAIYVDGPDGSMAQKIRVD